jgi:hypothetical protein
MKNLTPFRAVKLLEKGKKIGSPSWRPSSYVQLIGGILFDESGNDYGDRPLKWLTASISSTRMDGSTTLHQYKKQKKVKMKKPILKNLFTAFPVVGEITKSYKGFAKPKIGGFIYVYFDGKEKEFRVFDVNKKDKEFSCQPYQTDKERIIEEILCEIKLTLIQIAKLTGCLIQQYKG